VKVLVVGGGGREHALCWKLRQSPVLTELYCAPGNPGIAAVADCVPIAAEEVHSLADFAQEAGIDLTIVGPELPLTLGIVDEFLSRGLRIFGPKRHAAELEGSKVFAKEFLRRHGIPTADFEVVHDRIHAADAAARFGFPVVLKADGLAAGKGVLVVTDAAELETALVTLFDERRFAAAADRVVVEEFLEGEEVSFIALSDGERILPFATTRDHKRLLDGDRGPNTGGMGAFSPSGLLTSDVAAKVLEEVMHRTIRGIASEGRPFVGVLYAGLMLTQEGPKVLEFNARFGDPEAQALLLRLEDDLLPILAAGAAGNFGVGRLHFRKEAAAVIVLASAGYPEKPVQGEAITGLERAAALPNVAIFHSGTALVDGVVVASGGRVLSVGATGATLAEALKSAYAAASEIQWPAKILRKDIGRRALSQGSFAGESGFFRMPLPPGS
jgi:phosphoribosylamine---glycine ligase